jgi:SAM-dependent methyltransferase
MTDTFDPVAYWKERHRKLRGDHRATGNISRSPEQMLQRKLIQAYFFAGMISTLLAAARDGRSWLADAPVADVRRGVLDIGFGTGFLGSLLIPQGVPYTGYDLSEIAVEDAAKIAPGATYMLHDIVRAPAQPSSVILASEVLFHVVDDAQWHDALGNIAAGLDQSGLFMFTETFVATIEPGPLHFRPRTRGMYVDALARHGLRFVRNDELSLAAMPVFNQYQRFKQSLHFVRREA